MEPKSYKVNLPDLPSKENQHSKEGIASFIISLIALVLILIVLITSFNPGYWVSDGNNFVNNLQLPIITLYLIPVGLVLGIISLTQKNKNKTYGIIGLIVTCLIITRSCLKNDYN